MLASMVLVLTGLPIQAASDGDSPSIEWPARSDAPVLLVGRHELSSLDIALRQRQIRWKYGDVEQERARRAAHSQLVLGYVLAELLRREGHGVSEAELSAELARIDEYTKRPQRLQELKEIYGSDPGRYATIGILPDYANRKYFFEVFPGLDHVQAPVRKRAEQRLDALDGRDSSGLATAAEPGSDWRYRRSLFHVERGFLRLPEGADPDEPDPELEQRLDEWKEWEAGAGSLKLYNRLERMVFTELNPGMVFPQVIEFDRSFAIVRLLGWHDEEVGVRLVEILSLPKVSPHEYLWRQADNIEVWVEDDSIRRTLVEQKPQFARLDWRDRAE